MLPEAAAMLIADKGKDLTLRRIAVSDYDPGDSSATPTNTDVTVRGFIVDYKDEPRPGSLIETGDRKAVLQAVGLANPPTDQDRIIDGPDVLKVIRVKRIEESGVPVVYVCQVRK